MSDDNEEEFLEPWPEQYTEFERNMWFELINCKDFKTPEQAINFADAVMVAARNRFGSME